MTKVKPFGFWRDFQNVENELIPIINRLGHFPSGAYLRRKNHGDLEAGIQKHHGGLYEVAQKLGYDVEKKPHNFWDSEEKVLTEVRRVMKKHRWKSLPPQSKLLKYKYSSLAAAIVKSLGGFNECREKLGQKPLKVKYGIWKDREYVINSAIEIMQKHNLDGLPGYQTLSRLGYTSFGSAISLYHGGMSKFREILNQEAPTFKSGTWKNKRFAIAKAREAMIKANLEVLPTQIWLNNNGYSSLSAAIKNYYNGFSGFRKMLGEKDLRMPSRRWKDREFIIREAKRVIKNHNLTNLPSAGELKILGYQSMCSAISKYHGGYNKFRRILGEEIIKIENGKWHDEKYVLKELKKVMREKKMSTIPSSYQLQQWKYHSLCTAINNYHGGFIAFRKKHGEPELKHPDNSWKSLEFTIAKAMEFLKLNPEYDNLPSHGIMIRHDGGSGLYKAISRYHGGISYFREKLIEKLNLPTQKDKTESLLEGWVND